MLSCGIRNRGVTHYVDLPKSNKRKREEVATEDEAEELDNELADFPAEPQEDRWQASNDGRDLDKDSQHTKATTFHSRCPV